MEVLRRLVIQLHLLDEIENAHRVTPLREREAPRVEVRPSVRPHQRRDDARVVRDLSSRQAPPDGAVPGGSIGPSIGFRRRLEVCALVGEAEQARAEADPVLDHLPAEDGLVLAELDGMWPDGLAGLVEEEGEADGTFFLSAAEVYESTKYGAFLFEDLRANLL